MTTPTSSSKSATSSQRLFLELVDLHRNSDWLAGMEGQEIRAMVYTLQALGVEAVHMTSYTKFTVDGHVHSSATLRALEIDGKLVDLHGNIGGPAIRGHFRKVSRQALNNPSAKVSVAGKRWSPIETGALDKKSSIAGPAHGATKEEFGKRVESAMAHLAALKLSRATPDPCVSRASPRL